MAAAHDGDEDGGDDDGGAEHHQVVLERHDHRGDCAKGEAETSELETIGEPAYQTADDWRGHALHGGGLVMQ